MHWGWAQSRLQPSHKLVLMALADIADDSGVAWPSIRTLAAKCCIDTRTVQRILRSLETAGYVTRSPRTTAAGRSTSNVYQLALFGEGGKLPPSRKDSPVEGDTLARGRVARTPPPRVTTAPPPEPPQESKSEPSGRCAGRSPAAPHRRGLHPWEQREIATALKPMPTAEASRLIRDLAAGLESGSIRAPVQWVRAAASRHANDRPPGVNDDANTPSATATS